MNVNKIHSEKSCQKTTNVTMKLWPITIAVTDFQLTFHCLFFYTIQIKILNSVYI